MCACACCVRVRVWRRVLNDIVGAVCFVVHGHLQRCVVLALLSHHSSFWIWMNSNETNLTNMRKREISLRWWIRIKKYENITQFIHKHTVRNWDERWIRIKKDHSRAPHTIYISNIHSIYWAFVKIIWTNNLDPLILNMRFSVAFFIYSHYYDVVCLCSHSYKMMNSQLSCLSVDTRWYFCRLGFSLTVFFCVAMMTSKQRQPTIEIRCNPMYFGSNCYSSVLSTGNQASSQLS